MGPSDVAAVSALLRLAEKADGHVPLADNKWLDLQRGGGEGFIALLAPDPERDRPAGYAQLEATGGGGGGRRAWALAIVVDPDHRRGGSGVAADLLEAAQGVVADEGGGRLSLWVPNPRREDEAVAHAAGLRLGREVRQLRRRLVPPPEPAGITVRPFRPGSDEHEVLAVNNAAFAGHEEQGGWDLDALRRREEQPWFDPDGLLLCERDERLAGFCWTKLHRDHEPPVGELYVVAVDPAFQGHGLGRALTLAGLEHLAGRGIQEATLYVDAGNQRALRLYEKLGFTLDHVDRAYVKDVGPRQPTAPTPTSEPMP